MKSKFPKPQIFQMNAWYHLVDVSRVRQLAEQVLRDSDFELGVLPDEFGSWDLVKAGHERAWCAVGTRGESHSIFEIKVPLDSESALRKTLLSAFDRLLTQPRDVPAECILTAANPDVYPFFTHSLSRGSMPLTVVDLPEDGGDPEVHTCTDADYWDVMGRSMHFVASATMDRFNVSPEDWAQKIRAKPIGVPFGVVFDCGWSGTWPLPALRGTSSA